MKNYYHLSFSLLLLSTLVFAGNLQKAEEAIKNQDYALAYSYYLEDAEAGDAESQYRAGMMLYYSRGISRDEGDAKDWFKKAAAQGHIGAKVELGIIKYEGKGLFTLSDYKGANELFLEAAKEGNPTAHAMIGKMYCNGDGVDENYDLGMKWLLKGAELGSNMAQFELGMLYLKGDGVKKNYAKAMEWFEKAGKDNSYYQFQIAYMFDTGEENTPINKRIAIKWYMKTAKIGDSIALNNLGVIFARGKGVMQDYSVAHALFNLAAASGFVYDNDADDEEDILKDDDLSREYVNMRIPDAQVNEAISYARNPDKLWKTIDEITNISFTSIK